MFKKNIVFCCLVLLTVSCTKKKSEPVKKVTKTMTESGVKSPVLGPGPALLTAEQKENKQKMADFDKMRNKKYTPKAGDVSPEGFNWIHRDLALIYSKTVYEHNLRGRFHEKRVVKKIGLLKNYLSSLNKISRKQFKKWDKDHQTSFLLNTYNANILLILGEKNFKNPSNKWLDIKGRISLFSQKYSFNEFIKSEIQSHSVDPRIYLTLYCFEKYCPEFRNRIFNFKSLENVLKVGTKRFLINTEKNYYDKEKKIIVLSKRIKELRSLFPKLDVDLKKYLLTYLNSKDELFKQLSSKSKVSFK